MQKKLIAMIASLLVGLATLTAAGEPALKDQILTLDKELMGMRKATQSDPAVQAARAELQVALDKLNATVDTVMIRTNPKAKELLAKRKKLVEQSQAQPPAPVAKENSKP